MGSIPRCLTVLLLFVTTATGLLVFPEKIITTDKDSSITLVCRSQSSTVTWRRTTPHDGGHITTDVDLSAFELPVKRNLTLREVDGNLAGNFTCWSGTELQDHVYLLVNMPDADLKIHCTAESFSCSEKLKCTCTSDTFTAFRLRNKRDNSEWVSPSADGVFYLPHKTDSFSEETEHLVITGEAISSSQYKKTDYSFFLRDIVKPASANIGNVAENAAGLELRVNPPPTWSTPLSFFPLMNQVEYVTRDSGTAEVQEWEGPCVQLHKRISTLRVRCRDLLLVSQWSEWSNWSELTSHTVKVSPV